jgi:hypothetical protein
MAGLFDPTDPTAGGMMAAQNGGMGLMGMLANPQTAGLLGMAGGLLSAAGPSRLPINNGQALGAGFQGMQQGIGSAIQNQRALLTMQAMQGLIGGASNGANPQSSGPQGAPVAGSANTGPMSGVAAGMGSYAGYGGAPSGSSDSGAPSAAVQPSIFGKTPAQLWQQGMMMNLAGIPGGADMMKLAAQYDPTLQAQMPTDITKMGTQGGLTPQQIQAANAAGIAKANYIAPVNARPGSILRDPLTMQPMAYNPNIPAGGTPVFDASGNVVGINTIPGAANVAATMAGAKTAGEGSVLPYAGVDAQGNPLPVTNRTAAATQGNAALPLPLRNNNPGAVSPGGQVASYPDLQTGLARMDQNLASYAGQSDAGTLGQVITKWVGSAPNAPAYIKDVTGRLGVGADTPVDLTNPAQRQAIATAIMLHENGPAAVFKGGQGAGGQSPATGGSPIYAAPPLGATNAANAAQAAPSKQMADSYKGLADSDATYQQSRGALMDMMALAHQMGPLADTVSKLPDNYHNWNGLVTQYDKAHATFVANQYNALSAGTDAARGTVDEMVPGSDKPLSAKIPGLNTQLNNLDYRHLETQLMTPSFQQGDQKGYTTIAAQFHNTVKPEMMPTINPIMQMSGSQQQAAVQAAIKANPALRPAFETLFNAGMLK